jgi:hypothetical protein
MRKLGLKILKNKLSEFVRLAAASETVVITRIQTRFQTSYSSNRLETAATCR